MSIDLSNSTDIQVANKVLQLQDQNVADIGCGDGSFAAALAEKGARVIGVEPDSGQAEKNRNAKPFPGLELLEAGAEALPFENQSQDILIFRFSFHHIPQALHAQVFKEAARVLNPEGKLFVIEPVAEGPANYVMELFHDETEVRAQVQTALTTLALRHFTHQQTYTFETIRTFTDFSAYLDRYTNLSYNSYQKNSVDNIAVKSRFNEYTNEHGITELTQPVKADLFIKS